MAHSHHEHHDDGHDDHGHAHRHAPAGTRAFAIGLIANLLFTAIEAGYGLWADSLALLSDALHNLGDVLGLALAGGAAWLAAKPASAKRTYGYRRATLLAPLANALLLVFAAGGLGWEAVRRFAQPPEVAPWPLIVVAGIGIVVNFGSALLFRGHGHDLNQRGAYLHLMADAAVSLAVVLGGLGMLWLGWNWIDPALALVVGIVVAIGSWSLLRESLDLTLDAVPRHIDLAAVDAFLRERPGVAGLHDLHVWAMGSTDAALTVHLVRPEGPNDAFLAELSEELQRRFGIGHVTVQIESDASMQAGHECRGYP